MKNLPDIWNPTSFRDLNRMRRQFDRMLDWPGADDRFAPSCDVVETEKQYVMRFDLPGVKKEDVKIDLQENVLTVSGERKNEYEQKGKNIYHAESFYGAFERSFTLPSGVKAEQITAEFKDGVLQVSVPKIEAAKSKQIKVA